jgi:hypothetical protein
MDDTGAPAKANSEGSNVHIDDTAEAENMTTLPVPTSATDAQVQPADVLAGLGSADRHMLTACLALFEDSTLSSHLQQIYSQISDWIQERLGDEEIRQTAASVQTRMSCWFDSQLSDGELRLALWIYLREAFGLPARLSVSTRGAEALATELAAAAIHAADPPDLLRKGKDLLESWGRSEGDKRSVTLADVVLPVLHELMSAALEGAGQMDPAEQEKLIAEVRGRFQAMDEAEQQRILDAVNAKQLNDDAIRQILLTGGGLTAFSAAVSIAGFSAYILAAQASAFIPLVSGPALVSVVAVISNPITVIAATGGAIWWAVSSANSKVQTAVGLRVLALLALQGLCAGRGHATAVLASFARIEALRPHGDLESEIIERYRADWRIVSTALPKRAPSPAPHVIELMNRPAFDGAARRTSLGRLLFPEPNETGATAAVAALTLGDIAYSAAAIDPTVLEAADFARIDDIHDRLDFADFARKIHVLSPEGVTGAISDLKGYVAERVVAAELVSQGHEVSFPEAPNQPGWDLMVDEHKFQVKCLEDLGGLHHHFAQYHYPVFANAELADKIPHEWADQVFFVEGYSNELVSHVTQQSVDAGAAVFQPRVPIFTLALSTVRNLLAYQGGRVSGLQAVEQVVLDGSTRAGLAAVGGYAGTSIGLLVLGPAGAMVLGAVAPVLSQAQAGRLKGLLDTYVRTNAYEHWAKGAHAAIDVLVARLDGAIVEKLKRLRERYKEFSSGDIQEYVRARLTDEATFLKESRSRLSQMTPATTPEAELRALDVIRWAAASTVHPVAYQAELSALQKVIEGRPPLTGRIEEMFDALTKEAGKWFDGVSTWVKDSFSGPRR